METYPPSDVCDCTNNVFYETKRVRTDCVSSENLKYAMRDSAAYIRPKYNEWVKLLLQDIIARVSI